MQPKLIKVIFALSCCLSISKSTFPQAIPSKLFDSDTVLHLTISGSIRKLFNDRGDNGTYHPLKLSYYNSDNQQVSINLKAKTRGNFRRDKANCVYPPILLNLQKNDTASTIFKDQDKVKLVVPCREEKYVVREYLVYKLYNLLTPKSYQARLVKTNFYDVEKKNEISFYSILLEEDDQMAKRNGVKVLRKAKRRGEETESETFIKMAVFQYMIGNTDWSVPFQHNIRIAAFDSLSIPYTVPYDFDHAGIVNAPYALPPEALALRSTQERRFRGYCVPDKKRFEQVVETFNRLKGDIYNVYKACSLLDAKYVTATIKFLDRFYEIINNPKKRNEEFSYPCGKEHPNIVLKGLQED